MCLATSILSKPPCEIYSHVNPVPAGPRCSCSDELAVIPGPRPEPSTESESSKALSDLNESHRRAVAGGQWPTEKKKKTNPELSLASSPYRRRFIHG